MFRLFQRILAGGSVEANDRLRRLSRRWQARLDLESLGARNMLSANPVFLNGSLLVIKGTSAADDVTVTTAGGQVTVDYNGTDFSFNAASVSGMKFKGKDGGDTFENDTGIAAVARGGSGDDQLIGGTAADLIFGEDGADDCSGGGGDDSIDGGIGDDTIDGGSGADDCIGGDDDDLLVGGADDDLLDGGSGDDDLSGDDGNDDCRGGDGLDDVSGGIGDDTLRGNSGDDDCSGGVGDDDMRGGSGDDTVHGGMGADDCRGGSGDDVSDNDPEDVNDDCEGDDNEQELGAALTGTTAHGEAQFSNGLDDGQPDVEFEVEIEDAAANTTYDVFADGNLVGHVTTDATGEGEFQTEDPALLTGVGEGSLIEVKDGTGSVLVQGTLAAGGDD